MLECSRHYRPVDWDKWIFHLKSLWHKPNIMYLELGVFEGRSMVLMMETIFTHPTAAAFGVDPWAEGSLDCRHDPDDVYATACGNLAGYPNVSLIRKTSVRMFLDGQFAPASFDLIYIDADHVDLAVYLDLHIAWHLVKPHRYVLLDDCGPAYKRNQKKRGPRRALNYFLATHPHTVLHSDTQVLLRKEPTP